MGEIAKTLRECGRGNYVGRQHARDFLPANPACVKPKPARRHDLAHDSLIYRKSPRSQANPFDLKLEDSLLRPRKIRPLGTE